MEPSIKKELCRFVLTNDKKDKTVSVKVLNSLSALLDGVFDLSRIN